MLRAKHTALYAVAGGWLSPGTDERGGGAAQTVARRSAWWVTMGAGLYPKPKPVYALNPKRASSFVALQTVARRSARCR